MYKKAYSILILFIIAILLFYKPLLSSQPLGLDTLGHLSKVSYLKKFPSANWDMSWYSGTLFLKLYPPLFYYAVAIFPNSFSGSNLICFLSIFFAALGIYYLSKFYTKEEKIAIFSSISFLSVLSLSYYWISTGNLPYVAALWTIPFSLYFLEKSLKDNRKTNFIIFTFIFFIGILTHVIVGFIIGAIMIVRIFFEGIKLNNFKKILLYGAIPVLLSSFWFIPFLVYSITQGGYEGYVPTLIQLFGFKDNIAWGLQAGGIGLLLYFFVSSLFFIKSLLKSKFIQVYLACLIMLGFLLLGGLKDHYPLGVDAVRFILPFSIFLAIYIGLFIKEAKIFNYKFLLILFFILLSIGLMWDFIVINKNFERFSYYKSDSRYSIFLGIQSNGLPISDNFTNYRFGTTKFVFGETLNYFMPSAPQTFGYQDAGMLNAPRFYDMRWHIWTSCNVNDSFYWLDWFGIKYFEIEKTDNYTKFENNPKFKVVENYSGIYPFLIYEYLDAKPIISLIDGFNDTQIGKIEPFNWERNNPDEIKITYNSIRQGDVVLFKEFYHQTWAAKEIPTEKSLKIEEVNTGFMAVYPSQESRGVIFYQKKTFADILGFLLSAIGAILIILIAKTNLLNSKCPKNVCNRYSDAIKKSDF